MPAPSRVSAAQDLDGGAVVAQRARDGVDAHRCAERDQAVAEHDAEAGRHAAEEAALDGALDAQQIDRAERHGQQHADDQADRDDQGIGKVGHGRIISCSAGMTAPRGRCVGNCLAYRYQPHTRRRPANGSAARETSRMRKSARTAYSVLGSFVLALFTLVHCSRWRNAGACAGRQRQVRQHKKAAGAVRGRSRGQLRHSQASGAGGRDARGDPGCRALGQDRRAAACL